MEIPEDVRKSLAGLAAKLRAACQNARWTRVEVLHITLKFIGETPDEKVEMIETALAGVPSRASFTLNFRGLGFFPNERRPRVLWAGMEASSELSEIAGAVETVLEPLGIARKEREFSPHLTLARFDTPRGLDALRAAIETAGPIEFGSTIANEFHLYRSVLKRGGAEYTRLATFPFAGTATGTFAGRRSE